MRKTYAIRRQENLLQPQWRRALAKPSCYADCIESAHVPDRRMLLATSQGALYAAARGCAWGGTMRILTSVLGLLGALTAAYLGLYVGMIADEGVMLAGGDTFWFAAPLLALAGAVAVWLRPALARVALWAALIAWLMFGVAVAGLGSGLEGRHMIGVGSLLILPAVLLAVAAYVAGKLCRQLAALAR